MNDLFWLTLILLIVAAVLRSELFFYLLYVLVGLQVAARFWLNRSSKHLRWERRAPTALFPGEQATVELEIENTGLLAVPWLSLHESASPALLSPPGVREVISLGAGEKRRFSYKLHPSRRGYYKLGPLSLRTGDVLGLGERALDGGGEVAVTVYPSILPLAELKLLASLPFGSLPNRSSLFVDPAQPTGVRNYRPGDSIRSIDWKNSARYASSQPPHNQSLLVRRYQPAIALETVVALAFGLQEYHSRFAYDDMERALTAAASIVAHLIEQRQAVGFCTSGYDPLSEQSEIVLPVGSGRAHLIDILGILGRLDMSQEGDLVALLQRVSARLAWGSTLVFVGGERPDLLASILPLRQRGLNVALVLVDGSYETIGLARQHGIAAFRIERDGRPQSHVA